MRSIAALCALLLAGCSTWRYSNLPPGQLLAPTAGKPTRVLLEPDGAPPVVLYRPVLDADSIIGFAAVDSTALRRVALPVGAVRRVKVRKMNWLATTGLVLMGVGVALASQMGEVDVNPRIPAGTLGSPRAP